MSIEDQIISVGTVYNVHHLMNVALTKKYGEKDIEFIVKTVENGLKKPCFGKICGNHIDEYCVATLKCLGETELYDKYINVFSEKKNKLVEKILESQWGQSEESLLGRSVIYEIEQIERKERLNEDLFKYKKARCIKCKDGIVTPTHPDAEHPYYFKCDKCDFWIHYDPPVTVD